jgi:cytochrome c oxidase subunit IV
MTTETHATHHAPHGEHHGMGHVIPVPVLIGVFVALIVLTVITVVASVPAVRRLGDVGRDGHRNGQSRLGGRVLHALRYDNPLNAVLFVFGLVFVGLFVGFVLMDAEQYNPDLIEIRTPASN